MYDYQIFDQYFDLPFKYHQYPNNSTNMYICLEIGFLTKESILIEGSCTVLPSVILSSSKEYIIFRSTCRILDYVVFNEQFSSFLRGHGFVIKESYTPEEVKKVIEEKFVDVIATKNKGAIMKAVMGELKGKADGKVINQVVADLCK